MLNYLIQNNSAYEDEKDVYDDILLDPMMEPCALTSRLKQATLSTQLFIQRVQLSLEGSLSMDADQEKQWKWQKNYRLWEANRRVFITPENWLEPSLRMDKSFQFKDFENKLLKEEINKDNVETLYLEYLESVEDISKLEVVGLYEDKTDDMTTIHVVARTYSNPQKYYYRKRRNENWTAWEKIDIDIEGEHIIPIVYNGQFYIYWSIFIEKSVENNGVHESYYDVKLAWTRIKNNKWQAKRVSKDTFSPKDHGQFNDFKNINKKDYFVFAKNKSNSIGFYLYIRKDRSMFSGETNSIYRGFSKIYVVNPNSEPRFYIHYFDKNITLPVFFGKYERNLILESEELIEAHFQLIVDNSQTNSPSITNNFNRIIVKTIDTHNYLTIPKFTKTLLEGGGNNPDYYLYNYTLNDHLLEGSAKDYSIVFPYSNIQENFYRDNLVLDNYELSHPFIFDNEDDHLFFVYQKDFPDINYNTSPFDDLNNLLQGAIPTKNLANSFVKWNSIKNQEILFYNPDHQNMILDRNENKDESELLFQSYSEIDDDELPLNNTETNLCDNGEFGKGITFQLFEHPYIQNFIDIVEYNGLKSLFNRSTQQLSDEDFFGNYSPNVTMVNLQDCPKKNVDFEKGGPYSLYNWEIFYHIPITIANSLSQNQKFEDAMEWYHLIFNPILKEDGENVPETYWKFKKFYEEATRLQNEDETSLYNEILKSITPNNIETWQNDPFNPHAIAGFRTVSYMVYTVMKYIDNLVAWGDMLFKQDSMESLNEATQYYLLAAEILEKKPKILDKDTPTPKVYNGNNWDVFGNIKIENLSGGNINYLPTLPTSNSKLLQVEAALHMLQSTVSLMQVAGSDSGSAILYFCIPTNDKFLGYWDTVADRLFKLRNCMNIKGIERQLPLFQPPIDPGLIIRAKAAGLDLSTALSDLNAHLPHYRFKNNLQKAFELIGEVKVLGGALLSALEKKDGEDISFIRSVHNIEMQKALEALKDDAIVEATHSYQALIESKRVVEERKSYYNKLIDDGWSNYEVGELVFLNFAGGFEIAAQVANAIGGVLNLIPDANVGVPCSFAEVGGGEKMSKASFSAGTVLSLLASVSRLAATNASTIGRYKRRKEEWIHQYNTASIEIPQVELNILASEVRKSMAEKEKENLLKQIDQAETEMVFLEDKFTNKELYSWMMGDISTLYFQAYQMAYDMAKRAEKAFRFELGLEDSSFIEFGYWDNLKKGLLSGEKLYKDLQRMDVAYMEENAREYELTKHFSLAAIDPNALMSLRNTGTCFFEIPEVFYDLDYAGHYFRRIKSVSITIPAVTGPYTNVNCRLTMVNNRYRKNTNNGSSGNDYIYQGENDPRFIHDIVSMQSIATSSAQNDSGLFQFDFKDERYLPFEGAGAIGGWKLDMPDTYRQFDYDTIADAIITINYTAREGGDTLASGAIEAIDNTLNLIGDQNIGLHQMFSMKAQFANELNDFINPADGATENTVQITLGKKHFPYFLHQKDIVVNKFTILTRHESGVAGTLEVNDSANVGTWSLDESGLSKVSVGDLDITIDDTIINLKSDNSNTPNLSTDIDDIWIIIEYTIGN